MYKNYKYKYQYILYYLNNIFPNDIVNIIFDKYINIHFINLYPRKLCDMFIYENYKFENSYIVRYNSCYIEYCPFCSHIILLYYARKNILLDNCNCNCISL